MTEIARIKLSSIDPNPLRRLCSYPYNEEKIEALRRSIADVGLWEGVIGRREGNRVQIAFGHHRIEAARRELGKNADVSIILRKIDDETMLKLLGRENLEEYSAEFLVMLEAWESATAFLHRGAGKVEAIDIATILGWTRPGETKSGFRLANVADACNHASKLIEEGHLSRDQLASLSVKSVREICQTVVSRHKELDAFAKTTGRSAADTNSAKKTYAKSAAKVARNVRDGTVAIKSIGATIDATAITSGEKKGRRPLFDVAAKQLSRSIAKILVDDASGKKLAAIKKAIPLIELEADRSAARRIADELGNLAKRSTALRSGLGAPATQKKLSGGRINAR